MAMYSEDQTIAMRDRAEKAEALVDDLENQIAEGLAGMDQAEARAAELEGAGAAFINSWSGGDVQKAPMYAAVVAMEQALSGDGSAYADVVRAARVFRAAGDCVDERSSAMKWIVPYYEYAMLAEALDKLDGKETQDG